MTDGKHQFAFYVPGLARDLMKEGVAENERPLVVHDVELIHRVCTILRLQKNALCYLFDDDVHCRAKLKECSKKTILFSCHQIEKHTQLFPRITLCVGLVKRRALETIVYNATQLGVTTLQLLITEKSQRMWAGQGEKLRLKKIMIAASEQSKQYIFPRLEEPIPLATFLTTEAALHGAKLFFIPEGKELLPYLEVLKKDQNFQKQPCVVVIGPEGGFSDHEVSMLQEHQYMPFRLTSTILRSVEAVTVGVGALRLL